MLGALLAAGLIFSIVLTVARLLLPGGFLLRLLLRIIFAGASIQRRLAFPFVHSTLSTLHAESRAWGRDGK